MALAHDATVAAFLGAMRIINRNETVSGAKLSLEIRNVQFTGGSGEIMFDENGDRPGYSGELLLNYWFHAIAIQCSIFFLAAIYQMKPVWANIDIINDVSWCIYPRDISKEVFFFYALVSVPRWILFCWFRNWWSYPDIDTREISIHWFSSWLYEFCSYQLYQQ